MRSGLAIATWVVALSGCALSPPPGHDEVVAGSLPPTTVVPDAWQSPASAGPVENDWIKSFGDPVLESLVSEAIEHNRDLAQAAERVRVAQQAVIVAGARLRPEISAVAGARSTVDSKNEKDYTTNVIYAEAGWEPDVWGRVRARRASTEAAARATALDYAFARQSLAAAVARAWFVSCEARQLLNLADQSVVVFTELLKLVTIRRDSGKDSDLDVADTSTKLALARAQVEVASAAYDEARRALEVLLGRYPSAEIEGVVRFPALAPPPVAGVPAALLTRRPDLIAAEQEVLAAFRQEESARLALLPGFSISLIGGRLGDQLLSTLRLNPWLASGTVGMSVPIYEGGALRAKVEIATARQAQAVAAYGAAVLDAFAEVENALANQEFLARRLPYEEAALTDSTEAVRIATVQYRAGRRDLLWVSTLQSEQIAIHAEVIKVQSLRRTNRVNLILALGGGFDVEPAVPEGVAAR